MYAHGTGDSPSISGLSSTTPHSTHTSLLQKDFEKVTAALRAGGVTPGSGVAAPAEGARLAARLPLQKSVSTPSIVAAVQPHLTQPAPNVYVLLRLCPLLFVL